MMAGTAGAMALTAGALLGWPAVLVVAGGLALSAGYSLRPIRIADRGAVAAMMLPLGYVAVPYLVGVFAVRPSLNGRDLAVLGGLYVGFIGRILLKDFRDVRGDALFGKRTFLVRHGRRQTCRFSAACWLAGALMLVAVRRPTPGLVLAYAAYVAVALVLLRALSVERGTRRDEALISAIALVGRGMIATLLAHFSMTSAGWSVVPSSAVHASLLVVVLGATSTMVRRGPTTRLTVPSGAALEAAPVSR
jgi:4-hydroxybenzoate polyprenyltransferase